MKIYTLAESVYHNGHGDSYSEQAILRMDSYGSGEFPPCFRTKEEALKWQSGFTWPSRTVVELNLVDATPNPLKSPSL